MTRKHVWAIVAALVTIAVSTGVVLSHNPQNDKNFKYTIGLWGDLPYSQTQADAIPAIIEDMNSQDLVFTVQDGDLRQGSGVPSCADNSSNGAGGIVDYGNISARAQLLQRAQGSCHLHAGR